MKLPILFIALLLVIGTASALSLPWVQSGTQAATPDLVYVASFEGGHRFQAGEYPVIVLSGNYREMGRQYGALMKPELNEEYTYLIDTLAKRGYTREMARTEGRNITAFYPQRVREIFIGMSETSGLTKEDIAILYYGAIFQLMAKPPVPVSCSYLAAWGNYTSDGSVIASRNWDLDDAVMPFTKWYVLTVYRPSDGSNAVATWSPAGMRPETFMNSKGLFIADDNAGIIDEAPETRPEFITEFYRFMFDYSDMQALDAGIRGTSPDVGWIVDVAGPEGAFVYEKMTNRTLQRTGDGIVAAANHFVDPSWNFPAPPEHSLSRYNNLLRLAGEAKGSIDAKRMMQIRDVCLENGGAKFCHTLLFGSKYSSNHQVVFVPGTRTLWVNTMDRPWQKIELSPLFNN
ncbi:MAG TPA: C45 family peptidase [Methanoregula sp.]|nr:C45 family peptidase [Methanoregula sp.]